MKVGPFEEGLEGWVGVCSTCQVNGFAATGRAWKYERDVWELVCRQRDQGHVRGRDEVSVGFRTD